MRPEESRGKLYFGDLCLGCYYEPITYFKAEITVGEEVVFQGENRVLVDSGTSFTFGPKVEVVAINKRLTQEAAHHGVYIVDCRRILNFPLVKFSNGDSTLTLSPREYIFRVNENNSDACDKNDALCVWESNRIKVIETAKSCHLSIKSFCCNTISVPSCHASRRKHKGWDTVRLPKPRWSKSRGSGRFRTTGLQLNLRVRIVPASNQLIGTVSFVRIVIEFRRVPDDQQLRGQLCFSSFAYRVGITESFWRFGAALNRMFYTVYDKEEERVGFARSKIQQDP
ncbi:hypothetical protein T265_07074 [Opisthorchis viverrini]|uniref:Peptidase A1 domain-containing protein n=1 Tax=Opisthorchis viverrini TaxID=6198 RepID=A0A074ZI78_OPIVI|nr:hypothetical protein T265_07074 [Opisthorchis viverrini]KER25507.1 hypothetical protein T265_07074 [Opisthorchis viverrini]